MNQLSEEKEWIFALDIGTRNVVGVLGYEEGEKLHIAHTAIIEHKTRAMLDGQIHDIGKVTEVIKQVKVELENTSKLELRDVAIAAAGRVLKTKVAEAVIEFTEDKKIVKSLIQTLDMQGVESAKQMLYDEVRSSLDYYCVAYTPIKYYLDGYQIENLQGHKGKQMKATIIATFLPRQVIESLYSAVEGAGLSVAHLTLEPISAIAISIPKEIRMLNLALVDIGAGTSDIAITKEGSITAYGMLPFAGDKFSERLVDEYLINFETAEKIKKNVEQEEEVNFVDILGLKQCVSFKAILGNLESVLHKLTDDIANRILELNGDQPPRAVFCVGGGSQFPELTKKLSEKLNISQERVIVKDVSSTSADLVSYELELKGPEYITPIGICLTAWNNRKSSFIDVKINENKIKLLNTKTLTVMDAAIKGNYNSDNFMQKNGRDLEFTFNNEAMKIHGQLGIPAEIFINNKIGNLMSEIRNEDNIVLSSAHVGKDAAKTVGELIDEYTIKKVNFGGKPISIKRLIMVNGVPAVESYCIKSKDFITTQSIEILEELLNYLQVNHHDFDFYINGTMVELNTQVQDGDSIELKIKSIDEKKMEIPKKLDLEEDFIVFVNGKPIKLLGKDSYLFLHILTYIDFNVNQGKGDIILKLNGSKAGYTDSLKPQDEIEIYWGNSVK